MLQRLVFHRPDLAAADGRSGFFDIAREDDRACWPASPAQHDVVVCNEVVSSSVTLTPVAVMIGALSVNEAVALTTAGCRGLTTGLCNRPPLWRSAMSCASADTPRRTGSIGLYGPGAGSPKAHGHMPFNARLPSWLFTINGIVMLTKQELTRAMVSMAETLCSSNQRFHENWSTGGEI